MVIETEDNIFCIFGPSSILQANNWKEFSHRAGKSRHIQLNDEMHLFSVWILFWKWKLTFNVFSPSSVQLLLMKLRSYGQRYSWLKVNHVIPSNGGVERRNKTVEEKISSWMNENKSKHWVQALPLYQLPLVGGHPNILCFVRTHM